MTAIWGRIMPKGPQLGDFFEFEYVPLPNVTVERLEPIFRERVEQLKHRFDAS
jgi:hypothetical protein